MLWLLRHADAASGSPDSERPLTERGVRQAQAAGRALDRLGLRIDVCLTSPKARALETARIATERLGVQVRTDPRLAGEPRIGPHLDAEPLGGDPRRLERAGLGACQAHVDPQPQTIERASRGLRLTHAALGERTLRIGASACRVGVSEQPEHGWNCTRWVVVAADRVWAVLPAARSSARWPRPSGRSSSAR